MSHLSETKVESIFSTEPNSKVALAKLVDKRWVVCIAPLVGQPVYVVSYHTTFDDAKVAYDELRRIE